MTAVNKAFENQLSTTFKNSDVTKEFIQPEQPEQKAQPQSGSEVAWEVKPVWERSGLGGEAGLGAKRSGSEATCPTLNRDEQVFIEFLQKNPTHTLSTVEVYRQTNLSARKGTNVKNSLQEKGLIKIKEVKYDKGWKKLIRLS